MNSDLKAAFTKALVVLLPSYAVAFLTEKMVYVVPMLAAAGFFASTLEAGKGDVRSRVDDDAQDGGEESSSIDDAN